MRPLLRTSSMKLHNPSCEYVAIKLCSGYNDSDSLASPDVFDIPVVSFEHQALLH